MLLACLCWIWAFVTILKELDILINAELTQKCDTRFPSGMFYNDMWPTTMIFYAISSQKVRISHALKQEYVSRYLARYIWYCTFDLIIIVHFYVNHIVAYSSVFSFETDVTSFLYLH